MEITTHLVANVHSYNPHLQRVFACAACIFYDLFRLEKKCLENVKVMSSRCLTQYFLIVLAQELTRPTASVVEHETNEGFAVVDFVGGDKSKCLGERDAEDLDVLVGLGRGSAFADVAGEVDLHPLAQEAGTGEVSGEEGPAFGAVAGLFDHLAFGSSEWGFVGVDAAGGEFEEELVGGVAKLPDEDDVGVGGVRGLIDGQDDDGAAVADDVAGVDETAGLLDLVGEDGEDFTFVGEFGGDDLWLCELRLRFDGGCGCCLGGLSGAGLGELLSFDGHEAKVSSCI